ncbi:hypothetical protein CASFOL_020016 [Castilleja foliolosa]|uniref:Uncharacterized protein n=1 Tax=Castilleja foliolosa TaxID=1961234 RepID=A0ABD3D2F9_9LAMI
MYMVRMFDRRKVKFPLKVVLNKQKTKVLYAEVNSDLADVLLSFLTLPLGMIVRVLQKRDPELLVGSITTLYKGLRYLDTVHFEKQSCKQMLLNPRTSSEAARHKLKLNIDDTDQPTMYFMCACRTDCKFKTYPPVSIYWGDLCDCGKSVLSWEIDFRDYIDQGANEIVS